MQIITLNGNILDIDTVQVYIIFIVSTDQTIREDSPDSVEVFNHSNQLSHLLQTPKVIQVTEIFNYKLESDKYLLSLPLHQMIVDHD